jgi:hypothetical protein
MVLHAYDARRRHWSLKDERIMAIKKKPSNVDISDIRIECFLLCTYAQVESGKLDIIGGGWSEVKVPELPAQFGYFLAMKIAVPIDKQELLAQLRIRLVEDDRGEVIDDRAVDVAIGDVGELELEARSIAFAFVARMQLEISRPGRFQNQLWIAGQLAMRSGFIVKDPLAGSVTFDEASKPIAASGRR